MSSIAIYRDCCCRKVAIETFIAFCDEADMQVTIPYGQKEAAFEVADSALVELRSDAAPLCCDPEEAVRQALEHPFDFPPLRQALTPDDHIVVLIDERLPQLSRLLVPLLRYLVEVGIRPEAITLLTTPPAGRQSWIEDIPDELDEVRCEVHDPASEEDNSYLATMRRGQRLYFNRRLVDADQLIVLSGRRYDPFHGYGGGPGSIYPDFCSDETLKEVAEHPSLVIPQNKPWHLLEDAIEASWLLGAPFYVQVIEGPGDTIARVVAGVVQSSQEAHSIQDRQWRKSASRSVETVVATITGNSQNHTFGDFSDALICASRVVQPHGHIVLLTDSSPRETVASAFLREWDEPSDVLSHIPDQRARELRAAWEWATAAEDAQIFLLSQWPDDAVEEMFAMPLESVSQAQRLIQASEHCLFIPDAHKTLVVLDEQ